VKAVCLVKHLITLLVLFASLNAVSPLRAQSLTSTASLSGTVSDPSGARVTNATVRVSNPEKGITREYKTDSAGQFSYSLLPAGTYTLTAEAPGFTTTKQQGIVLRVGDSVTTNVVLTIGTSEQVTVTAAAPLLQTESANVSTEVSTKQIQELPLNLRNVTGLVLLNSSVNNQTQQQLLAAGGAEDTADQDESFLSFGGGFFGTTAFMLDGGWNVSMGWGGVIYVPSAEDVQEFKIQTNSFSSQYGWSTGNVVNVITRSGTNAFHFVAYDFLRNQALDANTYFNNRNGIEKTPDHRQQFGAAGGGPVYIPGIYKQRDKTFFFANYEGLRLNNSGVDSQVVPTPAFESGDFSALLGGQIGTDALGRPIYKGQIYNPYTTRQVIATSGPSAGSTVTIRDPYPGNMIPASGTGGIDALAKTFATGNYWPAPKNPGSGFNFNTTAAQPTFSDEYGIRVDHNFNQKTRIYGRWSQKFETKSGTPAYYGANDVAGPEVTNPNNRYSIALGGSHVFTPTFVLNTNATFNRWVEGNHTQSYGFQSSTLGLPGEIDTISPQFPQVNISGYAPLGARGGFGEFHSPNNVGSVSVDMNKVHKAQTFTFGFMGVLSQIFGGRISPTVFDFSNTMTVGPDPTNPTSGTGDGFASFMSGAGSSGYTGFNAFPAPTKYFLGGYFQDDWKVRPNLTLNLGLRYEVQTPVRERQNQQAHFDYHALNPVSVQVGQPVYGQIVYSSPGNRDLYNPNWNDFSPRVGFSYSLTPKFVMRGGFGLFYSTNLLGAGPNPGYSQSTNWTATLDGLTPYQPLTSAFSTGILPVTGSSLGGLTNVGLGGGGINPHRPDPKVKQFMLGFQYAFTTDNLIDLSYVGNRGTGMILGSMNYGQLDPKYLSMGTALNTLVTNPFQGVVTSSSCGLDAATVPQAQLLLPYPEFCGGDGAGQEPIGKSNYNALQANFTHRERWGLSFMASYTYSKFLDDVGGPEEWGSINSGFGGIGSIRNFYDLGAEWGVDSTDIPQSVVLNYVYELPVGRGKKFGSGMNGVENAIAGGWQISGISNFKAGFPLGIGNGGANPNSVWGGNQHATVVSGVTPKSGSCQNGDPVGHGICWFNPAAFVQTPAFEFGDAPRYFSNLRAPGYVNTDLAIQKWFTFKEDFRLQFRAEMFNVANHANFTAPDPNIGDTTFGQVTNTQGARQVQLALKLYR
jgi:hypothetical protein